MQVRPYLFFDGRCEESLEFLPQGAWRRSSDADALQGKPRAAIAGHVAPPSEDKVMHASFGIGEIALRASDGRARDKPVFEGISLSISFATDAEARRRFAALSTGGPVQVLLDKTFFASFFGMVADRFGVSWVIVVAPPEP